MPAEPSPDLSVDVAIVGRGFAGVAAACTVRRSAEPREIALLASGDGASGLFPGVLDGSWGPVSELPWGTQPDAGELLGPGERLLLQRLGFETSMNPIWVATSAGALRPVLARDPALLDLSGIGEGTVGVADLQRPGWDAEWLARAWSESRFARQRGLRFEARRVALREPWWRERSDYDLAVTLDQPELVQPLLRALEASHESSVRAWLLGPYLGLRTEVVAELAKSLGTRVGETTSLPGGVAGARLGWRRDALLDELSAETRRVRVVSVALNTDEPGPRLWMLRAQHATGSVLTVAARAVVLASGGIAGGGVQLVRRDQGLLLQSSIDGAFPASFTSREATAPASAFGPELVRLGAAGLARAGIVADGSPRAGLFLAGDVMVGAEGALAAVRSGIAAGQAVLEYLSSAA